MVFYHILFLSWWKNLNQSFSLLLWNYLLILKILSVTRFKDPKAAILTLKMHTVGRLWFCKIIPEAACCVKLILAHFLSLGIFATWIKHIHKNYTWSQIVIIWEPFSALAFAWYSPVRGYTVSLEATKFVVLRFLSWRLNYMC